MRSIRVRWSLLGVVLIAIIVYGGTGLVRAVRASGAGHDHTVFSAHLPNVPGKTLTAIVVEYGPGGSSSATSCSLSIVIVLRTPDGPLPIRVQAV